MTGVPRRAAPRTIPTPFEAETVAVLLTAPTSVHRGGAY
jgi:hypothetical protein